MPITLITGPANAGKAELVMEAFRGHLSRGEEPLLVVPTRADVDHYRAELAGPGALLGAEVCRFRELLERAARRAGVEQPVLGASARERLVRLLLARHGALAPGFARPLAELFAELAVRRVAPGRLRGALAAWAGADATGLPAQALSELFEHYRRALERLGCLDEEQRAVRALDVLRREPARWGMRPVVMYGFDDLAPLQLDAIETLGSVVQAPVTVSLPFEASRSAFAGRAHTFQALAPLASEHRSLARRSEYYAPAARSALAHLERSLFEPGCVRVASAGAVRVLEGASEREELELVARAIRGLLEEGMRAEEITVLTRAPTAGLELLGEVLAAGGIPVALERRRAFGDTALGAALLGILRSVPPRAQPDAASPASTGANGRASGATATQPVASEGAVDLLAWLRAPGVLSEPALADHLEAQLRRQGRGGAQEARELWEQRHWPLERIDRLAEAQSRGPLALARRAARELEWLFAAPRRGQACVLEDHEGEEARALAASRRALEELAELARADRDLAPGDASELAEVLAEVSYVAGRPPGPGLVSVLDPLSLRARRVRALFVCGMQEGRFPTPASERTLLGAEERRRLAEASGLRLGEQREALAAERYLMYAVASRPEELLVLSWHAAGEDAVTRPRSLFVDDVCDLFTEDLLTERYDGRAGAQAPARPRVPDDRRVRAGAPQGVRSAAGPVPIAPLRDPELLEELRERTWSASALETWLSCPVRWFVERVLRPDELVPDAEPLGRGGLAHAALKQTFEELRRETGSARVTPGTLSLARSLLARALHDNESEFPISSAPERRQALRRRLQADLERFLEHAARENTDPSTAPLEPTYLELEFGLGAAPNGAVPNGAVPNGAAPDGAAPERDGEHNPASRLPPLELGEGVRVRGRIDRVDVGSGGEAVVYDYKSGRVSAPEKWVPEGNLQVALYMRAAEQLLGLRALGGFYQPLAGSDLRARGVLAGGGGLELACVGGDEREAEEVGKLLDEAMALARGAAREAARGHLRPRPRTCSPRGGCMYPTICRCE